MAGLSAVPLGSPRSLPQPLRARPQRRPRAALRGTAESAAQLRLSGRAKSEAALDGWTVHRRSLRLRELRYAEAADKGPLQRLPAAQERRRRTGGELRRPMGAPSTWAATWKICYPAATPLVEVLEVLQHTAATGKPRSSTNPPRLAAWQQARLLPPMLPPHACSARTARTRATPGFRTCRPKRSVPPTRCSVAC